MVLVVPEVETSPDDLLGVGETAATLKVATQTVRNWADAGHLPSVRTPGGQRRFRRRDVEALLRFPDETPAAS